MKTKRNLALPQATQATTTTTLSYSRASIPDNTGINVVDAKIFFPSTSKKYIFTANYNASTKKLQFVVIDYSTQTSINGEFINPTKYTKDIDDHECKTIPSTGNLPNVHVPFKYFKYKH